MHQNKTCVETQHEAFFFYFLLRVGTHGSAAEDMMQHTQRQSLEPGVTPRVSTPGRRALSFHPPKVALVLLHWPGSLAQHSWLCAALGLQEPGPPCFPEREDLSFQAA